MRWSAVLVSFTFILMLPRVGRGDAQKYPFLFDLSLAADPAGTGAAIAAGEATLPPLPLGELTALQTDGGAMTLWFWPQNAALLQAIGTAGPAPMTSTPRPVRLPAATPTTTPLGSEGCLAGETSLPTRGAIRV